MPDESVTPPPEGGEGGPERFFTAICPCGHELSGDEGDEFDLRDEDGTPRCPECEQHYEAVDLVRYSDYAALERALTRCFEIASFIESDRRESDKVLLHVYSLVGAIGRVLPLQITQPSDPDVSGGEETAEDQRSASGSALDWLPPVLGVFFCTECKQQPHDGMCACAPRSPTLAHFDYVPSAALTKAEAESRSPKQSPPPIRAARQEPERPQDDVGPGGGGLAPLGGRVVADAKSSGSSARTPRPSAAPAEPQTRKCER